MDDLSEAEPMKRLSEAWWASRSPEIRARRCTGHRRNGNPCTKVALEAQRVCRTHGGAAPQALAKARRTIDEYSHKMVKELLGIATDENVSPETRLKAIINWLDRGIGRAPTTVDVGVAMKPWEEMVGDVAGMTTMSRAESRAARGLPAERLALEPSRPTAEVVDAEVVYERPGGPSPFAEGGPAEPGQGNAPAEPPQPGTGLMTIEEGNAVIAERNRAANIRGMRNSSDRHER